MNSMNDIQRISKAETMAITESRRSARGEQVERNTPVNDSIDRRIESAKTRVKRSDSTQGDEVMNQKEVKDAPLHTGIEDSPTQDRDNVLEFSATLRELKKHVDPNLVKQREGWRDRNGNVQMVDYVEWHTVADILDAAAPNWAHTVKDIRQIGDLMTVTVAITIDGVTREGIGTGLAQS